jgi:protein kinase-like protein
MTPEQWQAMKAIYLRAAEIQDPVEQKVYLDGACGGDAVVREQVERMLASQGNSDRRFDDPVSLQGKTVGPYQVLEKVGEGSTGIVYKARDTRLGRFVILKVLPHALMGDSEATRRFLQEARYLSTLKHPNIVTVYGIEEIGQTLALVMEYVEGGTLSARFNQGPLPAPLAKGYALQIASALAAAHALGIIHRDLKPSNILLAKGDVLKVVDFGLAKGGSPMAEGASAFGRTRPGMILGTVGYMSPEQARGEMVDGRSDIFSFGVLLYEMLSGLRAFGGASSIETMAAVLRDPVPTLGKSVPEALKRIVQRCLEKDPEARFQTALELITELQAGAASAARSNRQQTETVRHAGPWRLAVASIASALIAGVLVVGLWWSRQNGAQANEGAEHNGSVAGRFYRALDLQRKAIATGCFKTGAPPCDVKTALADTRAALADLDAVIKARPRHRGSLWNRGLILASLCALEARSQKWSQAKEDCDHAIADFGQALAPGQTYDDMPTRLPDEADVHFNRGLAHQQEAELRGSDAKVKAAELTHAIEEYDHILAGEARYASFLQKRRAEVLKARQIAEEARAELAETQPHR